MDQARTRLLARPTDYTGAEFVAFMESCGYHLKTTGGSSRKFIHPETKATLMVHEPHPANILKAYQIRDAIRFLRQEASL